MEEEDSRGNQNQDVTPQKGGLRTMPFIIANEAFQGIASVGILPNMILYLINVYHMDVATGTVIISNWSSSSDFLSIFGAFISDSYLGRFQVITLGSLVSVLGISLLWLTTVIPQVRPAPCYASDGGCQQPTFAQLAFLVSSFAFISIGSGCIKPCSMAFGADQLVNKHNLEKNARLVERFFNWYYACGSLSSVIALTIVVYIQDHLGWKVGFGVPAILMLLSALIFLVASSLYVKVKANRSSFTGLVQVPVAAIKNRHLELPSDDTDGVYHHGNNSDSIAPSNKLRLLNKACIIRNPDENLDYDNSGGKSWELCTVDQVETLKAIISVIPIWSTGIISYAMVSQSSITIVQATTMDRHITSNFQIPAGSFSLFTALSVAIWVAFYDRVLLPLMSKYTGRQSRMSPTLRMGIGLIISSLSMAVAAVVETIRRRTAIQEGLSDDPKGIVSMSAMWLIPQYSLTGISLGFNGVGQIEYYYSTLPQSMSSLAMSLFTLSNAFSGLVSSLITMVVNNITKRGGKESWLSTNPNKGHYDYQYGLLAFLCLLNFIYFLACCGAFGSQKDVRARVLKEKDDLSETLLPESREAPGISSASSYRSSE